MEIAESSAPLLGASCSYVLGIALRCPLFGDLWNSALVAGKKFSYFLCADLSFYTFFLYQLPLVEEEVSHSCLGDTLTSHCVAKQC